MASESIEMTCPQCGKTFEVKDKYSVARDGDKKYWITYCPFCQKRITIMNDYNG